MDRLGTLRRLSDIYTLRAGRSQIDILPGQGQRGQSGQPRQREYHFGHNATEIDLNPRGRYHGHLSGSNVEYQRRNRQRGRLWNHPAYGLTGANSTFKMIHALPLKDLSPATRYHFRISSATTPEISRSQATSHLLPRRPRTPSRR